MKHLVEYLRSIDHAWLTTWALIYVSFVLLDAFFPGFFGITILKMLGIILCVVYAWQKFRKDPLLIIALGFTLLADTILMINNVSQAGVLVFCLAQFFHTSRLKKTRPMFFALYLSVVAILVILSAILKVDAMYLLGAIYAYGLFTNLYLTFKWCYNTHSVASTCAFYGFVLFVCCDLCVALSYLSATSVIPLFFHRVADYFAWVFYYPSQVLISNSSTTLEPQKQKKVAKRG